MKLFDRDVVYGGLGGNLVPGTTGRDFFQRRTPGDTIYGGLGAARSYITDATKGNRPEDIVNAILGRSQLSSVPGKPKPTTPASPARPSSEPASQPQAADTFDYLDAPWASAYGMSRETAYSEAMENTAYRRSVADMQRAGLNPAVIFGAGNGYTAGSPAYVSSGSSGSDGGYSRRSSGRGKSSGKLFSTSAYSVLSALGGIVGAAATKSAGGYWLGMSLSQGAMSALNLLSKR